MWLCRRKITIKKFRTEQMCDCKQMWLYGRLTVFAYTNIILFKRLRINHLHKVLLDQLLQRVLVHTTLLIHHDNIFYECIIKILSNLIMWLVLMCICISVYDRCDCICNIHAIKWVLDFHSVSHRPQSIVPGEKMSL